MKPSIIIEYYILHRDPCLSHRATIIMDEERRNVPEKVYSTELMRPGDSH